MRIKFLLPLILVFLSGFYVQAQTPARQSADGSANADGQDG